MRAAHFVAGLAALGAAVLFFLPPPDGASPNMMRTAAVVVLALGLWSTSLIPEYLTSILFMLLSVLIASVPPKIVMSAFYSRPLWLVFGGLIIGVAVRETGFGARISRVLVNRFEGTYFSVVAGVVAAAVLLAILMPSSIGRVVIMLPIILALADRLGFAEGSNGRVGITLALAGGTLLPTFGVLTANVPSITMAGAAESIYGIEIAYGRYMLQHFPVTGPLGMLVLPFLITRLFPDKVRSGRIEGGTVPWSAAEGRLVVLLVAALGLWVTDWAHGISPAWIAMAAGVICLWPGIGVLPPTALVEKMNFGPWLYLAGMIGVGAVVANSGLGAVIADLVLPVAGLEPGAHGWNFASVTAIGMLMALVTTLPGQSAMMSAMAGDIASATGWSVFTTLMAQVPSWPLILFPYQAPPFFIARRLGVVTISPGLVFVGSFTRVRWRVMVPLQYVWWRFMGFFG